MSASMLIEAFAEHRRRGFEESRQERHTSFNAPFRAHTDSSSGHGGRYSLMLRNRIYYGLKPFVPQFLRTAIRRKLAMRLRKQIGDVWPIMPGSERAPENWPGWPENKQFAFVLTHDVESKAGLARCRSLMELEHDLGFRSSFNFIPEGSYRVPAELRQELTANGFEVGIHDLKHDGHLFSSRRKFTRRSLGAPRESTPTPASGERRDSDRDLCYVISIGCTISTCNTMHPPSIRIHSNRNPRAATRSFPSGFRIQMATRSGLNNQPSTLLPTVTLNFPIPFLKTSRSSCCCRRRRRKSGCENSIGSPNTAGWH
jgi:hypothetical protein